MAYRAPWETDYEDDAGALDSRAQRGALDVMSGIQRPSRPYVAPWDAAPPSAESGRAAGDVLDSVLGGAEHVVEPVGRVLGAPKAANDWNARQVARLEGINVPDNATTGWMLREAAGLDPKEATTIPGRVAGAATEFLGDVAGDPLTYLLAGAGGIASVGAKALFGGVAPKVLPALGRVAAGAFLPGMVSGALHEGGAAVRGFQENGLTGDVAEQAFKAGASGLFALGAGRHAFNGEHAPSAVDEMLDQQQGQQPTGPVNRPAVDQQLADLDALIARGATPQARAEAEARAAIEAETAAEQARKATSDFQAPYIRDLARRATAPSIIDPTAVQPSGLPIVAPEAGAGPREWVPDSVEERFRQAKRAAGASPLETLIPEVQSGGGAPLPVEPAPAAPAPVEPAAGAVRAPEAAAPTTDNAVPELGRSHVPPGVDASDLARGVDGASPADRAVPAEPVDVGPVPDLERARRLVAGAKNAGTSTRKALVDGLGLSPSKANRLLREVEGGGLYLPEGGMRPPEGMGGVSSGFGRSPKEVPRVEAPAPSVEAPSPEAQRQAPASIQTRPVDLDPNSPRNQAIEATIRQMDDRLRSRDVTEGRKAFVREDAGRGRVERVIGAPSVKHELGLADLRSPNGREYTPDDLRAAIRRKSGPLFEQIREVAEKADPFGYLQGNERAAQTAGPRYAYRARDIGEEGVPSAGHAQGTTSEEDVRRLAPSRTDAPQEVVRVDLHKLDPAEYQVIDRPGGAPWVKFKRAVGEHEVERVGPVTEIDKAAADKAGPELRAKVAEIDPFELEMRAGLDSGEVEKGVADVRADGVRELSPEAVAVKRAALEAMVDEHKAAGRPVEVHQGILRDIDNAQRLGVRLEDTELVMLDASGKEVDTFPAERVDLAHGEDLGSQRVAQEAPAGGPSGPSEEEARSAAEPSLEDVASEPKYATSRRSAPGQRGLEGISEDVQPEREREQSRQGDLFGATEKTKAGEQRLIPGTLDAAASGRARPTEGREANGPLFTQERDQAVREDKARQRSIGDDERFATAPTFYSQLERVATDKKAPQAASGNDWTRYLADTKRGVKADEMKWTGLDDYLKERGTKKVTKQEIGDFLKQNAVEVKEVTLGDRALDWQESPTGATYAGPFAIEHLPNGIFRMFDSQSNTADRFDTLEEAKKYAQEVTTNRASKDTKFSNYTLPGGENYKELLLTTPGAKSPSWAEQNAAHQEWMRARDAWLKDQNNRGLERAMDDAQDRVRQAAKDREGKTVPAFRSGHFDEPNILAHVRFNERTDAQGERVLFIEEVQSDFGQQGRRRGFRPSNVDEQIATSKAEEQSAMDANDDARYTKAIAETGRLQDLKSNGVPEAPFVDSTEKWSGLALRRMIRYAAEHGFEKIAWTRGDTQAERYDLSRHLGRIEYEPAGDGKYELSAFDKSGKAVIEEDDIDIKRVEEIAGKEIADKIQKGDGEKRDSGGYRDWRVLRDLDLKVGGEGMRGFYDKILPSVAGKLGKKFGATVGETEIPGAANELGYTYSGPEFTAAELRKDASKLNDARLEMQVRDIAKELDGGMSFERAFSLHGSDALADEFGGQLIKPEASRLTVHSMDVTPEMRRSVVEEGQPLFRSARGEAAAPSLTLEDLQKYVPGRKVQPSEGAIGEFRVGPVSVRIERSGDIAVNPRAFEAGHPGESPETVVGAYRRVGDLATIKLLAKHGEAPATFLHEKWHLVRDLGLLKDNELAAIEKRYGKDEEAQADAYGAWNPKTPHGIFEKVAGFFRRIYRSFAPDAESVFERVRSGEALGRTPTKIKPIPPRKFATAPVPNKAAPLGRPMKPGEAPRVEKNVEDLEEAIGGIPDEKAAARLSRLSRDSPRTWESLDPEIRQKIGTISASPEKMAAFYDKVRSGNMRDVDVQVLDSMVRTKSEAMDTARERYIKAKESDDPKAGVEFLKASLDKITADYASAARTNVEARTKVGRAMAAMARVMNANITASNPDAFMKAIFKQIPNISDKDAAGLLEIARDKPTQLQDALHIVLNPKWKNKLLEFWKAGLVSAPGTQVANILGNVGEVAMRLGETATASAIDPFFKGERSRLGGEARYELAGAMKGAGDSLGELRRALIDIVKLEPEKINLDAPLEFQSGAIGGKKGRFVRAPFRLLSAFDDFFKGIGGSAELHKLVYRRAGGDAAEAARLLQPENTPKDILEAVKVSRKERTFQNPNTMADGLTNLRNDHPWMHVIMPFIRTPANILRLTAERSPLGFKKAFDAHSLYKKAVAAGADAATVADLRGKAVDALARPLVGTMLMATFGAVAKAGGMTGSGPTDAKDRNALRDTGWQPYSFKIPSEMLGGEAGKHVYIPFNRFEPVSSLLGIAADMIEAKDAKTSGDLLDKGIGSIVQNGLSKSYLQGLADAAGLINDPKQFGSQYVRGLAGSVIPNIVAKAAQAIDPAVRDTKASSSGLAGIPEGVVKTLGSRLPGVSRLLPERRSGTGQLAERQGNAVTRFLSPVQPSQDSADADFARKLVDLDAVPTSPKKTIRVKGKDVMLTDDEFAALHKADEAATRQVKSMMRSPAFRQLPEDRQKAAVDSAYNRARSSARSRVQSSTSFQRRARAAQAGL